MMKPDLVVKIPYKIPCDSYPIFIQEGAINQLSHYLEKRPEQQTIAITDTVVAELYQQQIKKNFPKLSWIVLPTGEQHKNLQTLQQIYKQLADLQADRSSLIIAIGGGVIGDMAGLAAATYMRGISLVQVPTTLLAMIDASVGGKVAVNLPQGKNMVGAFKQPVQVIIDPLVLQTLPQINRNCGIAEIIKHSLIADPTLMDMNFNLAKQMPETIRRALKVKINLVEHDPFEHNIRMFLNLGHTFGHAIEKATNYNWYHGEAIAVGLVAASILSERIGLCQTNLSNQLHHKLQEIGLPTNIKNVTPQTLYDAMIHDKKRIGHQLRFILLKSIAHPVIHSNLTQNQIISTLEEITHV